MANRAAMPTDAFASGAHVLRGGRVVDPATGRDGQADVRVVDGIVAEVGPDVDAGTDTVVDCTGLWVMPGFVDLHTHLREPGFEDAEDVATGSAAAAAGGYTAVCAMANTDPVCDSAAVAEMVRRRGREVGLADVFPVGAITRGLDGAELAEMGELHDSAANVTMFSDDGRPVADALIMRRALQYATRFDAVVCNHAEDPQLTADAQMNEGEMSSVLGLPGWPREAEEVMIARDLVLAHGVGARLHVPHVTTRGAVEAIRAAKARGIRVTAEVTPHHLTLDDHVVATYDPVYKVNPPLRTWDDVLALREGLADGTIDAVATDHAPHPPETKDQEWDHAPCGMLGLETAFALVLTELVGADEGGGVERGSEPEVERGSEPEVERGSEPEVERGSEPGADSPTLDLLTAVARFTTGPAGVRDLGAHGGSIAVGAHANLAVVDPSAAWTVVGAGLRSRARNTPFEGRKLTGRVVHTLLRGRFTLRDGEVLA